MQCAVDVTLEFNALLLDPAETFEGEHLKSARIGEHGTVPRSEPMQPSHRLNNRFPRPKVQVVGVAENDLSTGAPNISGTEASDHRMGADWHERWGFDLSVWK